MPDLNAIIEAMYQEQQKLEQAINATPTGKLRETITEANIHLLLAINELKHAIND